MRIEYFHASKFGNGATVAEAFRQVMAGRGVDVGVHHIKDLGEKSLPAADLYLFSSPGRMGRPIGSMRRFLKSASMPASAPYALLTTEMAPKPDKKTGRMPTEEDLGKYQHVRPIMNEILRDRGLTEVAEEKVYVTAMKGPLEDGWQTKVDTFAERLLDAMDQSKL